LIPGCTELHILLARQPGFDAGGIAVDLVAPTLVVARRCIALARASQSA
jgi:aspartate racemase